MLSFKTNFKPIYEVHYRVDLDICPYTEGLGFTFKEKTPEIILMVIDASEHH